MSDSVKVIPENAPAGKPREKRVRVEQVLADEEAYLDRLTLNDGKAATRTFGMAISGGGIRSATFGLGVLQGIARAELLRRMKYISTVSGGGYIGGWLISWIHRTEHGVVDVEKKLGDYENNRDTPRSPEPKQINFLRDYSNYMTPRVGIFGADTWAGIATYLRNVLLNQTILAGIVGIVLLFPWFFGSLVIWLAGVIERSAGRHLGAMVAAVLAAATLFWAIGWSSREGARCSVPIRKGNNHTKGQQWAIFMVALPLFVSASFTLMALWLFHRAGLQPIAVWMGVGAIAYGAAHAIGLIVRIITVRRDRAALAAMAGSKDTVMPPGGTITKAQMWGIPVSAMFAGAVGGLLMWLSNFLVDGWRSWGDELGGSWHAVGGGPPILVTAFLLVGGLHIGLLKLLITPEEQEWWGRLGGLLLLGVIFWAAIFGLSIFAPWASAKLAGAWGTTWVKTKVSLLVGWIGSTVLGLISGRSPRTSGKDDPDSSPPWEVAALVAPYVFILGLLIVLSVGAHRLAVWRSDAADLEYWQGVSKVSCWYTMGEIGGLLLLTLLLAYRIDINIFSMNLLYRNRLVRCYLGASRTDGRRQPNRFTGFDPADDLFMTDFDNDVMQCLKEKHPEWWPSDKPHYDGPYPIVCAALNVTHGQRLAWQERKAESFVFTPKYCGFDFPEMQYEIDDQPVEVKPTKNAERTVANPVATASVASKCAFRDTENYAYPQCAQTALHAERGGLHLGTAISISGAAASPNMGFHTSPPLAFLMTVFDVRMGWWLPNSRYLNGELPTKTPEGGPPSSVMYLLKELAASTTDESDYVYLSDGGHFENLAIYELVRRRCKFIIACDGDADKGMKFGDLGNCIRKCRSDFGVEITIDVDAMRPQGDDKLAKVHAVLGSIRYPAFGDEPPIPDGKILYIKPTITKNVPRDTLVYRAEHKDFPDQTTADQWFDESQFESYRRLGQYSFDRIFAMRLANEQAGLKQFFDDIS
jgi:heme/copper-type cytochrome/quinol oxidase subunit 2